jgi:steroid delta-isomerase-like uncharacterized protein
VYEDVALRAVNRTPDEMRRFISAGWAAFPDLRFEPTGAAVSGSNGVVEWTMLGTHKGDFSALPATGKPFAVRDVSVMELSGEKIRRVRDYWVFAAVLRQLGVLPASAAA